MTDYGSRAILKYRWRLGGPRAIVARLVVVILGVWGVWAASTFAAPRPSSPVSAETTAVYEGMKAAYDAAHSDGADEMVLLDSGPWSDADRVRMTAAALQTVMQWESQQTWRPGFEKWLRNTHELTPEEIVDVVDQVNAKRSVKLAIAVFESLGKPSP